MTETEELCPKCGNPITLPPGPDPSSLTYCMKYHLQAFGNYRFCFSRKADERLRLAEKEGARQERERLRQEMKKHIDSGNIVSWALKFAHTQELIL